MQNREEVIPLLDFAERARTVNAKGEYVDHRYIHIMLTEAGVKVLALYRLYVRCVF